MKAQIITALLAIAATASAQKTDWVRTLSNQSTQLGRDHKVAVNDKNEIFLMANFYNAVSFGKNVNFKTDRDDGTSDGLILKVDPEATKAYWGVQIKADVEVKVQSIAATKDGGVYVGGVMRGAATFGSIKIAPKSPSAFFVTKLSAGGKFEWVKHGGSFYEDAPIAAGLSCMTELSNGNVLLMSNVVGMYPGWKLDETLPQEEQYFGKAFYENIDLEGVYTGNNYVMLELNSNGEFVKSGNVGFGVGILDIEESQGNIYLTGHYAYKTAVFGKETPVNKGLRDGFATKLKSDWSVEWLQTFGAGKAGVPGLDMDEGQCLAIANDGTVYLGGKHYNGATFGSFKMKSISLSGDFEMGTFFVAALSKAGEYKWVKNAQNKFASTLADIATDGDDVFISAVMTLKKGKFEKESARGPFVAKVSKAGEKLWMDDADDRKGRTKIKVFAPGSLAISADGKYLITNGNAIEKTTSSNYLAGTTTTSTSTIISLSKVKTD